MCPFCNLEAESNSHILFTCSFAWGTWMEILRCWGIKGVLHDRCNNFFVEWCGLMRSPTWKKNVETYIGLCNLVSVVYEKLKKNIQDVDS